MLINATVCLESRDFEQAHNTFKRVLDYITGRAGNINIFNYNKFGNDEGTPKVYTRPHQRILPPP